MFPFYAQDRKQSKRQKKELYKKVNKTVPPQAILVYPPPVAIDLDEGAVELSDDTALAPVVAPVVAPSTSSTVTTPVPQQAVFGTIKPVPLALLQKKSTPAPAPATATAPTPAKKIVHQHYNSRNKIWANKEKIQLVTGPIRAFKEAVAKSSGVPVPVPLSKKARKRAAKEARRLAEAAQEAAREATRTVVPISLQPECRPPPVEEIMDFNPLQWGPAANNYGKGVAGIPKSFLLAAEAESRAKVQNEQAQANNLYKAKQSSKAAVSFPKVYKGLKADGASSQGLSMPQQNDQEAMDIREGSESPQLGEKRLSAFDRLGPVTQPKKPKLTINLLFTKEQATSVREVVNVENKVKEYIPVHKREVVLTSTHEIILKYLAVWPWKVEVHDKKIVGPRESKTAMLMEEEQMAEYYELPTSFIKVTLKQCPKEFEKEDALDLILEQLRDYSFIPCFIDMHNGNCTFLVIKCSEALLALHKLGLRIQFGEQSLPVYISTTYLKQNVLNNFVPKLILRKMVVMAFDEREKSLNLKQFSLQPDISNFIYFPLNRIQNQIEFLQLQSVQLNNVVELDLSHNRLTSIDGLNLGFNARRLKRLDLSFNYLDKMTTLLQCRNLLLDSLKLEGNPLCNDYTDPEHYKRIAHLIFPTIKELDGIKIKKKGEIPPLLQTYCHPEAKELIEIFLQTFFPILDSTFEDRMCLGDMYYVDAVLTITFKARLRSAPIFRYGREMFSRARCIKEGNMDEISGAKAIAKNYARWPNLKHDPLSFTIDVLLHEECTTIFRVGGLMKATAERLTEDEHMLAFTRTFVIHSADGMEYKIHNEMLYFDEPSSQSLETAFQVNTITRPQVLKFDSNPDAAVKESLTLMLSDLTELGPKQSERCLSQKNWDLRAALEYFMALLKLNSVNALDQD